MKALLLFISLVYAMPGFSQAVQAVKYRNLVPNGSFENSRKRNDDFRNVVPWRQIETIDYYCKPLDNDTTPDKGAASGDCYAGFRFRKNYREFIQVKLAEPLHRGTIYEFSMQVRLAFWSNVILKSFGALFTKGGYRSIYDASKSNMVDTVCIKGYGLHNNYRWFTITGFYKADGGEKYLTIGNFAPVLKNDMMNINVFRFGPRESYYFVDDVVLKKAEQFEEKIAVQRVGPDFLELWKDSAIQVKEDPLVGETIQIKNIQFENGKSYLLPESFTELNKLALYLIKHPNIEMRINGHSDNSGLKYKNQKMSEMRAREVFEYLIRKGVQNKLYFKGFGSSQPVADNNTEEGRARNRRVEFEIIRK